MPEPIANTPEERLQAFRTDYVREHAGAAPVFDRDVSDGFEVWEVAVERLERTHGTADGDFRLGNTFSQPAEHDPEHHPVTAVHVDGDRAVIRTETDEGLPGIVEFELCRVDGDWRINGSSWFAEDPDSRSLTPADATSRAAACAPDAPPGPLPRREQALDPAVLFAPRDVVDSDGESGSITISEAGVVDVRSGRLTVVDLTYPTDMAWPLLRMVPPGRYPVETSVVFERNAALRVRLGAGTPTTWHPAATASGGHVFGVDGGNLCVADFDDYVGLTVREHERLGTAYASDPARPVARTLSVPGEDRPFGVVADSGWGDGAYGAYWGVDATGVVQQLVVLFGVLMDEEPPESFDVDWRAGPLVDPRLAAAGVTAVATHRWRRSRLELTDPDDVVRRLSVVDAQGRTTATIDLSGGSRGTDGTDGTGGADEDAGPQTYEVSPPPRNGSRLRFELEPRLYLR